MRAEAKGIVQSTDLVPMGLASGEDDRLIAHAACTTPPGPTSSARRTGWCSPCPAAPVEWLYHDLRRAGVSVERVGDCVAPRRAHAAVVDGERAGQSTASRRPITSGTIARAIRSGLAACGGDDNRVTTLTPATPADRICLRYRKDHLVGRPDA